MILQFLNFGGGLHFLNLPNPKNAPLSKTTPISSSPSSIRCVSQLTGNALPVHDIGAILHNKVRFLHVYFGFLFSLLNERCRVCPFQVLVSAVVSAAVGQLTKPFANTILYGKKFDFRTVFSSGGFPSTHSSVISLS